jgi:TolB protein
MGSVGARWRPDGKALAVTALGSQAQGEARVHLVSLGGGKPIQVTSEGYGAGPDWAPDGLRIALNLHTGSSFDIAIVNADGSGLRKFGTAESWEVSPYWSPDGAAIAFLSKAPGNWEVALLDPSTGEIRMLTTTPGDEGDPHWTPDGKSLVFSSQDGSHKLVSVRVEALLTQK